MKKVLLLLLTACSGFAAPGEGRPDPKEIVQRFAEREAEFRRVWQQYTYTQKIQFEVLDDNRLARERRTMVIEVYFTNEGIRKTRTVSDRGRLKSVGITDEDMHDAIEVQPFVLTTEEIPNYEIKYVGEEVVDELDTFVFDVKPRKIRKKQRYFQGRVWVESAEYKIVMTRGKAVPDYSNNKFPQFETRREQIDGDYWFPTWTLADDVLTFGDFYERRQVHVRQLITYENYKKFEVKTTIRYARPDGAPDETKTPEKPKEETPKPQ